MSEETSAPPGPSLRDPAFQDLCGFFATFEEGRSWQPQFGDWVVVPPSQDPLLVGQVDLESERLLLLRHSVAEWKPAATDDLGLVVPNGTWQARANCRWLPTLDQLRALLREHFGTTGFFSSTFNNSTYWYTGQMLGMTVTNMQPLAEGKNPEEAAMKALLMRHSW